MRNILITLIIALCLAGCSSDGPGNGSGNKIPRQEIPLSRSQQEIVTSQHEFAVRLFRNAIRKGENNILSPLSASMALSMVANGAGGNTFEEISTALGLKNATIEDVNDLNRILLERLPVADNSTTLAIVNSLWVDTRFGLFDEFRTTLADCYNAPSESVDLYSDEGKDRINRWVTETSGGKINGFLSRPPQTEAALINSLYFKSIWSSPFPKSATKKACFNNESGSRPRVEMMVSGEGGQAITGEGIVVARLGYGNSTFLFNVILPPEEISISDFIANFDSSKFKEWDTAFTTLFEGNTRKIVKLEMPKFAMTSEFDLIPALEKMGIEDLFHEKRADLSGMSDEKLFIKLVKQRSSIEVDEEGVVAVSTTEYDAGVNYDGFIPIRDKVVLDRPFIYYISEYSTGAILFMGNVSEL